MQSTLITDWTTKELYTYGNVEYELDFPAIVADDDPITDYCDDSTYEQVLLTDTL